MATAQVYLAHFYSRVELRRTNPYSIITASIYLACKVEEAPKHIQLVVTEASRLWPGFVGLDTSKLGKYEFYLVSEISSQLIVHQPYKTLVSLHGELSLAKGDIEVARSIINGHYMTDLPVLCDPHIIALVASLPAPILRPNTLVPEGSLSSFSTGIGLTAARATMNQVEARRRKWPRRT